MPASSALPPTCSHVLIPLLMPSVLPLSLLFSSQASYPPPQPPTFLSAFCLPPGPCPLQPSALLQPPALLHPPQGSPALLPAFYSSSFLPSPSASSPGSCPPLYPLVLLPSFLLSSSASYFLTLSHPPPIHLPSPSLLPCLHLLVEPPAFLPPPALLPLTASHPPPQT
jgi:hypothetical protein